MSTDAPSGTGAEQHPISVFAPPWRPRPAAENTAATRAVETDAEIRALGETALREGIVRLTCERHALLLAHNYQPAASQDLAHFVGDSLELSQEAARANDAVCEYMKLITLQKLYRSLRDLVYAVDRQGLERAREEGVTVVINLREPGEMPWDEKAAAEALGLTYIAVPVARDGPLSKEAPERVEAVVEEHPGEQVLVHCSAGNRAAAWLATHLVRSHGMKAQDALAVGKRAGLTKAETAVKVEQYLDIETGTGDTGTPRESGPYALGRRPARLLE